MPPKATKPIFKTSSPYAETHWPKPSTIVRDNILDLLCSLLQPLGDHRRQYMTPSKGRKRKRNSKTSPQKKPSSTDVDIPDTPPPPPEIVSHILVGLNSVTRHLEALATQTAPSSLSTTNSGGDRKEKEAKTCPLRPISLVIIPHPHPPSSLPHAHIPALIHLANLETPSPSIPPTATRLIAVPPPAESLLSTALYIPSISALAILEDAPGANALVQYVREHVGVTECRWIDEAMAAEWKGVVVKG
ncbi:hypothetical protein P280DRAFT_464155 [Massarina eburnea CBS 473.64]|uniref:Uncharacterized protein n=1 Tax=Massarina eburnea CBS 473.64 TaxID=1395130 RepID=A0A6A6RFK3_9PLEO|nr:hypothetical protein P280DRAFT_464155 [Massarina eburnea CBS 473.64]